MHPSLVHTYGNIISYNDTISYVYQIKPMNSLYVSEQSANDLVTNLYSKLAKINMQGEIIIRPVRINEKHILDYYEESYQKYGKEELLALKNTYMQDLKKQLFRSIRYRYEIYIVFCQGRPEINKRVFSNVTKGHYAPLEQYVVDSAREVDKVIYDKLSTGLSISKPDDLQCQKLLQYLQIPFESTLFEYYVEPRPRYMKYNYTDIRYGKEKELLSQTFIATKLPLKLEGVNRVLNEIQLFEYPVDIIIKFDFELTKKFAEAMSAKKHKIEKDQKMFRDNYGYDSVEYHRERVLAMKGETAIELGEDCKAKFQLMFRIRANDEEMLQKREKNLRSHLDTYKIEVNYKVGRQEQLRNNLIPFDVTIFENVFTTDIKYMCNFNFLGGLYIGEETDGFIISSTVPARLPILVDFLALLRGETKNLSTTTCIAGESGGGKSQLSNSIMMICMLFLGMKVLCVDPKGDRYKLATQLGDNASNLVIGSSESHQGMFDPFILYKEEGLEKAKTDIVLLARSVNPDLQINIYNIDKAYDVMMDKIKKKRKGYTKPTLLLLAKELVAFDELVGETLLSLSKGKMARLFFASQDTVFAFDLSKPFNLVTFADVPNLDNFDKNNIDHQLFSLLLSKTEGLLMTFLRENQLPKLIAMDEYKVWKATTQGAAVVENVNRIIRSMQGLLVLISQSFSDFEEGILQNTSQFFVGSLKSEEDIEKVISFFDLTNNLSIRDAIVDRTKSEGVIEAMKYNFLYSDYNNRKCMAKLEFLDLFKESFDTHLHDERGG